MTVAKVTRRSDWGQSDSRYSEPFGARAFCITHRARIEGYGPVGRVAMGELAGAALVFAGSRYHRQGWQRFSTMLSAAGIVVLYLATYSAFGFYPTQRDRNCDER